MFLIEFVSYDWNGKLECKLVVDSFHSFAIMPTQFFGQHSDVSGGRVPELPHQRHQQIRRSGLPQERVMEQFGRCGSLGGVTNKHLVQESLQARRHLKQCQFKYRTVS